MDKDHSKTGVKANESFPVRYHCFPNTKVMFIIMTMTVYNDIESRQTN